MQIKALIYAVLFVFDELVFKLINYTIPYLLEFLCCRFNILL